MELSKLVDGCAHTSRTANANTRELREQDAECAKHDELRHRVIQAAYLHFGRQLEQCRTSTA
ncbi:MAG TPA: hypothetical protein PKW79_01350 [Rhabdochlamydiaceae bacterium]|nr:hypothetical protein [Rhabdochlamydiaceae bacterium]